MAGMHKDAASVPRTDTQMCGSQAELHSQVQVRLIVLHRSAGLSGEHGPEDHNGGQQGEWARTMINVQQFVAVKLFAGRGRHSCRVAPPTPRCPLT